MQGTCRACGQVAALTSNGVCWDCADQIDTRPDYAAESRWMASALDGAMRKHRQVALRAQKGGGDGR